MIGSPMEPGWADGIGGLSTKKSQSIATDLNGNVYMTGYFSGTVDFDPGPGKYNLTSKGGNDIFVAKYSPEGTLLWAKSMGYGGPDIGYSIAVGSNGLVYIAGSFTSTVDFDPGPGTSNLTSAGGTDIFICVLDTSGNYYYAWRMGGTSADLPVSIALGSEGNLVMTGYFAGSANFYDPYGNVTTLTSLGGTDFFLYNLDANWQLAWVKRIGGVKTDQSSSLALDSDGNILVTGFFTGTVDFDPGIGTYNLASAGSYDIFIAKYSQAGDLLWAKPFGTSNVYSYSIAVGKDGSVFTTGIFLYSVDFDPGRDF